MAHPLELGAGAKVLFGGLLLLFPEPVHKTHPSQCYFNTGIKSKSKIINK